MILKTLKPIRKSNLQQDDMTAQKQVALVVGASRGIGRQVAIDLAKNGYAGIS